MAAHDALGSQFEEARSTWEGDMSMEMTHAASHLMGNPHGWSGANEPQFAPHAKTLMSSAKSLHEPVYSGHGALHDPTMKQGDRFTVPLMATTTDPKVARNFASDASGNTVYRFKGAKGVPINSNERVITGQYKVRHRLGNAISLEGT